MNIGDKAPELLGTDQDGKEIKLSDYKGKKIVLYFYPKDSTPGCTSQACSLRDNYELMQKRGYAVIGVSVQDEKSHKKFIEKYNLPFPLKRLVFMAKRKCAAAPIWALIAPPLL